MTRAILVSISVVVVALSGCSGSGGSGEDGLTGLVRVETEAAGNNCAEGGLAVKSGLDLDGDGVLSDSEVKTTQYVCNGENGQDGTDGGSCTVADNGDGTKTITCEDGTEVTVTDGNDGNDGNDGHDTLFDITQEAPGDNCANGGYLLASGLDLNDDGMLAADEITNEQYVCNGLDGADGTNSLVSVMTEDPGGICPDGGLAMRTGLDADGDGVLQPGEVTSTEYVCNGATGSEGSPGLNALVRQEDEFPGGNCEFGGQVIFAGLDVDGNDYLDADEVTDTAYVCNGAPGDPGHVSLFTVEEELPGDNCAQGGWLIESGLDADDSGVLEPGEVQASAYVCHGNGGEMAIRVTSAWPGGACPNGGVRVETGPDADGDGVLDDDEVQQVQYACNLAIASVDAGDSHSCAMRTDGTVWCWGSNAYGQLGDGTTTVRRTRVQVSGLTDAASISLGSYHSCAVKTDGTAWCWGQNTSGQLGDGTTTQRTTPVLVAGLSDAATISTGGFHTCAARTDETVWCWGRNSSGQLGDGTTTQQQSPVQVSGLADVSSIALGDLHTCAAKSDGSAWCWGYNNHGQLGDGTTTQRTTPVLLAGFSDTASISSGDSHTCAVKTDGTAWCWGYNNRGQLGDGTTIERTTPVPVVGFSEAASISAGPSHTCASRTDGTAWCWGFNGTGQLGDGSGATQLAPVQVLGFTEAASVSAGTYHTCASRTDGTAWCWGYNLVGQLGDGSGTNQMTPVRVVNLP